MNIKIIAMEIHSFKKSSKQGAQPEFIRLPKQRMHCPYTGLSRTTLNELILPMKCNSYKPPVKSISFKHNGNKRGIRLINFSSLLDHIKNKGI